MSDILNIPLGPQGLPGASGAGQTIYFSQTATATVPGTVETTLIGAGSGSLSIPANTLAVGDVIRFRGMGYYSKTANHTFTFRSKIAGNTLPTATFQPTNAANGLMLIEGMYTIRTIGVGGTAIGAADVVLYDSTTVQSGATQAFTPQTATFAINTTAIQTYDFTVQVSNAGSSVSMSIFVLYKQKI